MSKIVLRQRQKEFVSRFTSALYTHGNTLGVAVVGFGKTIALGATIEELRAKGAERILVTQHRDELVSQNRNKVHAIVDGIKSSVFDGSTKDMSGDVVFGMVQSLSTPTGLAALGTFDAMIADEAHHCPAPNYLKVIEKCRSHNPKMLLGGVTATANRGDGKGMSVAGFTNVCDQVSAAEMIQQGFLVPPKTFVVDLGVTDQLKQVKKTRSDFDDKQVAAILDHQALTKTVIEKWREKAGDRKTVVFCSSVEHAQHVTEEFKEAGIRAEIIHGDLPKKERKDILERLRKLEIDVLCNVGVLVEGFDFTPISCIILLRQSSHSSAYIQMIGRGLRIIVEDEYAHIVKNDCIVLDFGVSTLLHGTIESEVKLYVAESHGECVMKTCPVCDSEMPASTRTCPMCGYEFPKRDKELLDLADSNFCMTEIDILNSSPFRWEWMTDDCSCRMASGFNAWAGVFWTGSDYAAFGGLENRPKLLFRGDYVTALDAADTFLINHEQTGAASKVKQWLQRQPTKKQVDMLMRMGYKVDVLNGAGDFGYIVEEKRYGRPDVYLCNGRETNRYIAGLFLSLGWNRSKIKEML